MPIYIGSTEILSGNLQIGSTPVQEVFVGSVKVWPPVSTLGGPRVLENDADTRALEDGVDIRVTEDIV